jgi:hypothetical protein
MCVSSSLNSNIGMECMYVACEHCCCFEMNVPLFLTGLPCESFGEAFNISMHVSQKHVQKLFKYNVVGPKLVHHTILQP